MGIATTNAVVILFALGVGCMSRSATEPYPPPPDIGSVDQRNMLAQKAREAVVESDPTRRIHKLLELRALANTIAREADDGEAAREAIAIFFAKTAHIAILNGDHSRGKGGFGSMPTEVTDMPERVPQEMVALRITQPQHWIQSLHAHMRPNNSLAGRMARAAGGFETSAGIYPRFLHLGYVLDLRQRDKVVATSAFDGLIEEMLRKDRVAAASQLLRVERGLLQNHGEQMDLLTIRRQLADMQQHYEDQALKRQYARTDAPMPYDAATAEILQELAERPEWAVHLYVLSYMAKGTDWYDQAVIDRITAHQNPVSLRFLARSGMIDPALVPEPANDPYKMPSGARVIPSSRATSRPAAAGRD